MIIHDDDDVFGVVIFVSYVAVLLCVGMCVVGWMVWKLKGRSEKKRKETPTYRPAQTTRTTTNRKRKRSEEKRRRAGIEMILIDQW